MAHMLWELVAADAEVPTVDAKVGTSMVDPTEEFWNRNGKSLARRLTRGICAQRPSLWLTRSGRKLASHSSKCLK